MKKNAIMIVLEDTDTAKDWVERLTNNDNVESVQFKEFDDETTHPVIYTV